MAQQQNKSDYSNKNHVQISQAVLSRRLKGEADEVTNHLRAFQKLHATTEEKLGHLSKNHTKIRKEIPTPPPNDKIYKILAKMYKDIIQTSEKELSTLMAANQAIANVISLRKLLPTPTEYDSNQVNKIKANLQIAGKSTTGNTNFTSSKIKKSHGGVHSTVSKDLENKIEIQLLQKKLKQRQDQKVVVEQLSNNDKHDYELAYLCRPGELSLKYVNVKQTNDENNKNPCAHSTTTTTTTTSNGGALQVDVNDGDNNESIDKKNPSMWSLQQVNEFHDKCIIPIPLSNQGHVRTLDRQLPPLHGEAEDQYEQQENNGLDGRNTKRKDNSIKTTNSTKRTRSNSGSKVYSNKNLGKHANKTSSSPSSIRQGPKRKSNRSAIINSLTGDLPKWEPVGRGASTKPPPLCGCTLADQSYIAPQSHLVAARTSKPRDEEEVWILATVVGFNTDKNRYQVEDIMEEVDENNSGNNENHYTLSRRGVIPLPTLQPCSEAPASVYHPKNCRVLALYPRTTCFYPGTIVSRPNKTDSKYTIEFKDDEDVDGTLQKHSISQRFVIPLPKNSKFKF